MLFFYLLPYIFFALLEPEIIMSLTEIEKKHKAGYARTAVMKLLHDIVNISVFMPVGINATVKAMFHESLTKIGHKTTYHLCHGGEESGLFHEILHYTTELLPDNKPKREIFGSMLPDYYNLQFLFGMMQMMQEFRIFIQQKKFFEYQKEFLNQFSGLEQDGK